MTKKCAVRISVKTARATGRVGSRAPRRRRSIGATSRRARSARRVVASRAATDPRSNQAEFVFQLLILLLDRPPLMGEVHQRAGSDAVAGRLTRSYLVRGVDPRSRSQSSQTAGATRRLLFPVVPRGDAEGTEAGSPRRIRAVAPRRRGASRETVGLAAPAAATLIGCSPGGRRGRAPRAALGRSTRTGGCRPGVPRKTFKSEETPGHRAGWSDARCDATSRCRRTRHRRRRR